MQGHKGVRFVASVCLILAKYKGLQLVGKGRGYEVRTAGIGKEGIGG